MLIDCPLLACYRSSCRIGPIIKAVRCTRPAISSIKLYAMFLNDSRPESFCEKYEDLLPMYLGWHNLMKIDM